MIISGAADACFWVFGKEYFDGVDVFHRQGHAPLLIQQRSSHYATTLIEALNETETHFDWVLRNDFPCRAICV